MKKLNNNPLTPTPVRDLSRLSPVERRQIMLEKLATMTQCCSLCNLGRSLCVEKNTEFDPHVFSNLNFSKWMVIGQNPGFNECMKNEPFVGDAGNFFEKCLTSYGLTRKHFYISNVVRCHSVGNAVPTEDQIKSCRPILQMELAIIRPTLITTLGAVAFKALCPTKRFRDSLGTIVHSEYGFKVFPIYHPSPRNMADQQRKKKFIRDVKMLCKLIKAYQGS